MARAKGIHAHPKYKLGRRVAKRAPSLKLSEILKSGNVEHPLTADHFRGATFGLYGNDQYGDCGPVSVANLRRAVSAGVGGELDPTQDDVFDLYRRSGNPNFDPNTDADDNGVDMQTMLEALLAGGIGSYKPVAFAQVDVSSDSELDAAMSIFGGVLWGVTLQTSQQSQTDENPPKWDYVKSSTWGGHAVLAGKYDEASGDQEVISWNIDVATTPKFRQNQLDEAWVVIWQENVDHPAFQEGIDLDKLKSAYKALTGKDLNVTPTPSPDPGPSPSPEPPNPLPPAPPPAPSIDPVDQELVDATINSGWASEHHHGMNRRAALAVKAWAHQKGYSQL